MKKTQADLIKSLDTGTCIFGADVLLKHLQSLEEEVEGVRTGGVDIEFIHRARVASRRLRAALPLFKDCLPRRKSKDWLKRISKITRTLGEARDSDVQIEVLEKFQSKMTERLDRPGVNRLLLRLRQRRKKLDQPVSRAMDKLIESQVLEAIHAQLEPLAAQKTDTYLYTPTLYQHSFQSIHRRLEELLAYEEVVNHPEQSDELHQMRIATKWLRYTMETFSTLYSNELKPYLQAVKKTQELLGDLHDCDVWLAFLPQFLEEERQRTIDYFGYEWPFKRLIPGIQHFEQDRQQKRAETYQEFLSSWQQWQAEGLWSELHKTIQIPFLQPENIYPPLQPPEIQSGEAG